MPHHLLDINEKHRDDDNNEVSIYRNTYQLEPYNIFKTEHVDKIISTIILASLLDSMYNTAECAKLCNTITNNILTQIQKLQFGRY